MRIFYQHNVASTRIGLTGSTRALSYGRLTLAIRHSSLFDADLVASTMMNTPIAIFSPEKIVPLNYTPFGFAPHKQQENIGFNGEYPDPLTGNYGLGQGYRWYSSTLKRFQAADDISPFGLGGISAYAYTHNDPVNRFDPDGQQEFKYFRNLKPIKIELTKGKTLGFFASTPNAGKPSLFIHLHGDGKSISYANRDYGPTQFLELMKDLNININDYKKLVFTSCFSALTFAPKIARITKKPAEAPAGIFRAKSDFNTSSNTYTLKYLRKPDADFFLKPRQAPAESYAFGLQKFAPPQTQVHDIRGP